MPFWERLKEALQKLANVDLDSYEEQVIFKGQILVPICIRHQDKVVNRYNSRTLLPL